MTADAMRSSLQPADGMSRCPMHGGGAVPAEPPVPERPSSEVPGPPPTPLAGWRGNALRFFRNPVTYMSGLQAAYGDVARLAQGGNGALFFKSRSKEPQTFFAFGPENNRRILRNLDVFQNRMPPGPPTQAFRTLSTNMFFITGKRHKEQRRLMMPAFTREGLASYYDDFVHYTEKMLDGWQGQERVEVVSEMCKVSLHITGKCFYGLDPSRSDHDLAHQIYRMVDTLFSPASMIPINLPGTPYNKLIRSMEVILETLRLEVEKKRDRPGEDVLSRLVAMHDEDPAQLTADELVGEALVMFLAGHDTTAKALTWILFLLAQHPRVTAALAEELDDRLGGAPPAYAEAFDLPLLDRVIKECLRLLSPALVFARETTEATTLGGYEIPAYSEVIYSPYLTHVDERIFPEPRKFLPDRWLTIHPSMYEYLPFGAGARTCLGASMASVQLRIMVAMIVQRYAMRVVPGTKIDLKTTVVMSPRGTVPMILYPQDGGNHGGVSEVRGFINEMVDFD